MYTSDNRWLVLACRGCGLVHTHIDLRGRSFEQAFEDILAHMTDHPHKPRHVLDVEDKCIIFSENDKTVHIHFNENGFFKGFDSNAMSTAVNPQQSKVNKPKQMSGTFSTGLKTVYNLSFDDKLDQLESIIDKYMKVSSSYDNL